MNTRSAPPLISAVIPLHNKGDYVGATLQSLQRQSYSHWEAIVVENHSSDRGPETVAKMAEADTRIRLFRAPPEIAGPGAARNFGMDQSGGDWLLFLDADDLILPEHIRALLTHAEKADADIAVSHWLEFPDGTRDIAFENISGMDKKEAARIKSTGFSLVDSAIAFAPWAVHCALIKKACLKPHDRWLPHLDRYPSEDTAFWFRVLHDKTVACTDQYSALYRIETPTARNRFEDLDLWSAAMRAVTEENLRFLGECGKSPGPRQCEALMRLWENIAMRADKAKQNEIFRGALQQAEFWLGKCPVQRPARAGILLRKLLGIALWIRLRALLSRQSVRS